MAVTSPDFSAREMSRFSALPTQPSVALLVIFFIALLIPASFEVGGTRLSPIRLFLLACIVPFFFRIVQGQIGRFTWVDGLFLLHGVWILIALAANHGLSRIPFAGITAVEIIGGYFVGRALITNKAQYRQLFVMMLISILCLLPFAIFESLTGKMLIPDLLRPFFETPFRGRSAYGRMGLERVYAVFEHPILWGLFCSLTIANFLMIWRKFPSRVIPLVGLSIYTTFLSLSSAPLLACGLQFILLTWGWLMRGRWMSLIVLSTLSYIVIDLLSNRTPVTILIETLTFNANTGWTRIAIFDYGWAAVLGSPIFGIGFNDWVRPGWLTSSVDNFWLLVSMRYGLIGALFIVLAFLMHFIFLARAKIADPEIVALRIGHAVALAAVSFTLVTVHIWGALSVFVMFYVGAGAWMYVFDHSKAGPDGLPGELDEQGRYVTYTRFPRSGGQEGDAFRSNPRTNPGSNPGSNPGGDRRQRDGGPALARETRAASPRAPLSYQGAQVSREAARPGYSVSRGERDDPSR